MRKHIALAAALTITVAGCSSTSHTPALPGTTTSNAAITSRMERIRQQALDGKVVFAAYLKPVGDCDALLAHLHTEAGARVGPYGLPGIAYGGGYAVATGATGRAAATDLGGAKTATAAAPLAQSAPATSTAAPGFSGTNNQEAAVDEPDIIKTDGKRIVTLTGNKLTVVNVDGGAAGTVRSTAIGDATFAPSELLVVGDHALVIGSRFAGYGGTVPLGRGGIAIDAPYYPYNATGAATITEVDLSGTSAPKVGSTLKVDGSYLAARLVGSTVRMVVRSEPQQLDFVTPQNKNGEDRARKTNEDVILESKIDAWLPSYELLDSSGKTTAKGLLTDCANVDAPTEFAGFGSLSVLTFDATKPLTNGNAVSILAGGNTVYASDANLYVATETWIDPATQDDTTRLANWERDYTTSIHEFSIDASAPARYVASGTVPGYLLNQFSMSEYKGVLRAASTRGVPWGNRNTSESFITTLKQSGDKLTQLGQVGNMGRGERLYSVRFADDAAYVVTFRQTDPFYTVNLADPAKPSVVGELKINGYSGYLHPIGDNLVIGVGQDATSTGRVQGAKVSLFDVADLANPKELAKWSVPNAQTGVEWDHHALLWWPTAKTLVFPLMEYANSSQSYGAVVLHVDRATGITEQGRVAHGTEKPTNLGATVCRKLTQDELNRSGMNYFVAGEQLALSCEKGQVGGAIGYQCSVIDPQQFVGPPNAGPTTTIAVPAGGHIEICYPIWNQPMPIQRSLVIGSSLWTLSPQHLQANALDTLARTARVDL